MQGYTEAAKLLIYGGLILAFGCAFAMSSLCHLWTSSRISSFITDRACTSLSYCKLSWFEDQNIIKVAGRINKVPLGWTQDYEKFYGLNSIVQNICKNITLLLASLILVGFSSYIFFPIGIAIIFINGAILFYFMRAERELFSLGAPNLDTLNKHYS